MTVSDPGAGQQQGREETVEEMAARYDLPVEFLNARVVFRADPAPSATPPARDKIAVPQVNPLLQATLDGSPAMPLNDSPVRDEAREAVVEAIVRVVREEGLLDPERVNSPELTADCLRGSLLALPELDKLLRRPA